MIDLLNSLPSPLVSFVAFIVTILFLVTIHEFGHFWVARRFGVRIEKFSIGFGKPIFKWYGKRDNTEYSISWIPLGGYVKMYGEEPVAKPEGELTKSTDQDINDITDIYKSNTGSFTDLPPIKRMAIAFAGPAINLLFAIFAFWLLFVIGVGGMKPVVGSVSDDSILGKAGVHADDTIIKINQRDTVTLTDSMIALVDAIGNPSTSITVLRGQAPEKLTANLSNLPKGSELNIASELGLKWKYATLIDDAPAKIKQVSPNMPAEKAGILSGDTVIQIDQQPISTWVQMSKIIQKSADKTLALKIQRGQKIIELSLTPASRPGKGPDQKIGIAGVGLSFDPTQFDQLRTTKHYGPLEAIPKSISNVYVQSRLLLKTLWRLIVGEASIKNMGGPITIADTSGQAIRIGYEAYFNFLALISLTLAVMNLLPIPALDGGHILLCAAEMIKGSPLSERAISILMRVGIAILLSFMALVIGVDLFKYLGRLF